MAQFKIDPRANNKAEFVIEAEDHSDAATAAARAMFGKKVVALRQSGTARGSGMFQAYTSRADGTQSSYGNLFHVMEL